MATNIDLTPGTIAILSPTLAASSTGASSVVFAVQDRADGADRNIALLAVPTGSTTVTVDVEVSDDGGTTWAKKDTSVALVATSTSTMKILNNFQPGWVYRLNVTTNTGGTSVVIKGTSS